MSLSTEPSLQSSECCFLFDYCAPVPVPVLCLYLCMYIRGLLPTEARRALSVLELELQAILDHPVWLLKNKCKSSSRAEPFAVPQHLPSWGAGVCVQVLLFTHKHFPEQAISSEKSFTSNKTGCGMFCAHGRGSESLCY
jgi:hypothetical protein